ncbi:amylo-alpha-1,6-glucosidase [soil metagenome]
MFEYGLTLKAGEMFFASNIQSDGNQESAAGLYFRDTRFLSECDLTLNGKSLELLSVKNATLEQARVYLTNPAVSDAHGERVPGHQLSIIATLELTDQLTIALDVQSFYVRPFVGALSIKLNADFRDLFDVRGFRRDFRGTRSPIQSAHLPLFVSYRGVDDVPASTIFDIDDRSDLRVDLLEDGGASIEIALNLNPGESIRRAISIQPNAPVQSERAPIVPIEASARVRTGHPPLDNVLAQAERDLQALDTPFAEGTMPAAGIPWFVAPFGRDSLIVGLQTLHLRPNSAIGTLQVLATLQGVKEDPITDEQPGKILHEVRYGEMARTKEIPHRPYYGTVDATPLFAWLVAEAAIWTGDAEVWENFKPHAKRAIGWIETFGDVDGDGLVEYPTHAQTGAHISHKVWKDSFDSLHYADGRPGSGLIAAVEVQAYVFAAYDRLSVAAEMFGDGDWANSLRRRADGIRETVEQRFWLEDEGFYAQALDTDKQPIGAISSNPGHLLFAGLPSAERARRVADRLVSPDMSSGWGIRTLSSSMPSYNPMSYHNGSVWPHDNSLAIAGLYRYGFRREAESITEGLLRAAYADPDWRLPELYCGYELTGSEHEKPVAYPVSCSPQAWASGAFPLIVRSMLGLRVDPETRSLRVEPQLPDWIDLIEFSGARALGAIGDVNVVRTDGGFEVSVAELSFVGS